MPTKPTTSAERWIVAYDIGHRRRWAPIYKLLKKHGIPLQYSLFEVSASPSALAALMEKIRKLINPREDDVRAYRIPAHGEMLTLGQPLLAPDLWITEHSAAKPAPNPHRMPSTATPPSAVKSMPSPKPATPQAKCLILLGFQGDADSNQP